MANGEQVMPAVRQIESRVVFSVPIRCRPRVRMINGCDFSGLGNGDHSMRHVRANLISC